jgi:hypothetical protein
MSTYHFLCVDEASRLAVMATSVNWAVSPRTPATCATTADAATSPASQGPNDLRPASSHDPSPALYG